jgi:hypothetical protein
VRGCGNTSPASHRCLAWIYKRHNRRYCREFHLRYNTRTMSDTDRVAVMLKGMAGKRLTYRRIDKLAA